MARAKIDYKALFLYTYFLHPEIEIPTKINLAFESKEKIDKLFT